MTELSHARTPAASHDVDQDATTSCGIQAFMALSGETRTPTGLDDMGARGPDPDRHPEYGPSQRGERCLTPSTPSQCW